MTAYASVPTAVEAMKLGAFDYIQKPFEADQIGLVVDRAITATLTSEILSPGRVVYAGTASRTAVDTVAEDAVASLEAGSPERGRGAVPDMQSLDRFVEPLVIIGAAGAAIFLFFQVRS